MLELIRKVAKVGVQLVVLRTVTVRVAVLVKVTVQLEAERKLVPTRVMILPLIVRLVILGLLLSDR